MLGGLIWRNYLSLANKVSRLSLYPPWDAKWVCQLSGWVIIEWQWCQWTLGACGPKHRQPPCCVAVRCASNVCVNSHSICHYDSTMNIVLIITSSVCFCVCPFVCEITQKVCTDLDESCLEGFDMAKQEVIRFWWQFWVTTTLPLWDWVQTDSILCSPGGSTVLAGGLRALVASSYYYELSPVCDCVWATSYVWLWLV